MNNNHFKIAFHYYKKWKNRALAETKLAQKQKAIERALFWGEMLTSFAVIKSLEEISKTNKQAKKVLLKTKLAVSKRLREYSQKLLNELDNLS